MASSKRPIDSALGSQVRLARIEQNMSQATLAARLGVSIHQVHAYEEGHDRISASSLIKVSMALQKDVSYFFSGRLAAFAVRTDSSHAAGEPLRSADLDHGLSIMQLMECVEHENADYKERLYDLMMSASGRSLRTDPAKTHPATPLPHVKTSALD